MEYNLLLAGVGGQGILTIAQAVSRVAVKHGYEVKQSETHGMSQRGGAVQAHLRFANHAIHSDVIPLGKADMLLAVEPLEALRYAEYLNDRSTIVANSATFQNIPDYPPTETVLEQVSQLGIHVLIDAPRLAKAAGSGRSENMVMLGAASNYLDFPERDFEEVIREAFASKGDRVLETNIRAFRIGRRAASLFREAMGKGLTSEAARRWIDSLAPAAFESTDIERELESVLAIPSPEFSEESRAAVRSLLNGALNAGRNRLFEHEVYRIVELAGAIKPPRHHLVRTGEHVSDEILAGFSGDQVVLKIVSADVVHKSEARGVRFVPRVQQRVQQEIDRLFAEQAKNGNPVEGVLIVEFVEQSAQGLGAELFVGIRNTREFGPVIAAGLGGLDTEYLATTMRPGVAVAKAAAMNTTPERFFELFTKTAAYEILAGKVRGHDRLVSDQELMHCFGAFLELARHFGAPGSEQMVFDELEVNPFAFQHGRLIPLDGRGRLARSTPLVPPRPWDQVARMLEPKSIAVMGVSGQRSNFGRIILNNIQDCGFPQGHLYVVKSGADMLDGTPCYESVEAIPESVDLLVAALGAAHIPELVDQLTTKTRDDRHASSVILISGALGETEGTHDIHLNLQNSIAGARFDHGNIPVFLGGNCLGVRSRPGKYDTFFIPASKLDPRRDAPPKRVALVSQSGGFLISRMSNLEFLDPMFCISLGNQVDITVSDVVNVLADREDLDCIGVYTEGFNDLDGLAFLRSVERATAAGKVVVFYKAGRTSAGRAAAMGHTASLAGDYEVCLAAVEAAGALVTETFKEFEQIVELATDLHDKQVNGKRLGAISNAGYEAVGMGDAVRGVRYQLTMPALGESTRNRLVRALDGRKLAQLVDAKNPLDVTPMADDAAYEDCIRVFMQSDEIDAILVGCVPMTPTLLTTPVELNKPGSLCERIPRLFNESNKPLVFVLDCTGPYDHLAREIREAGVPVFRTADQAVRSLGRYLSHRHGHPFRPVASKKKTHSDRPLAGSLAIGMTH